MISKTVIQELLAENKNFILTSPSNLLPRENIFILPSGSVKKVVTLYGVRRSGKTHLLYDLFRKNPGQSLYLDFEDERLEGMTVKDFLAVEEVFFEMNPHLVGQKAYFFFDEIQNIENWEKFCRRLVEKTKIQVIVSGSSSKIMPNEIHTSLRGRSWGVELLPFSFGEFVKFKGLVPSHFSDQKTKVSLLKYSRHFIEWGGFPEIVSVKTESEKKKILGEYFEAMYFRDLVERYQITNIALLQALMNLIFSSPAYSFSLFSVYKKLKEKIPISKDYLYQYYNYFLESLLVYEVKMFSGSAFQQIRNPPKIYLVDTGLSKKVNLERGRLLENAVFLELHRCQKRIFYYQQNHECDFITEDQNGHFQAIQVTFELSDHNKEREIAGLVEACEELNLKKGLIVTLRDEQEFKVGSLNISVIPFWKWALSF